MPYIEQSARARIDAGGIPQTEGELNYLLTTTVLAYLGVEPQYADHNAIIGALECCKLELYRTKTAVYEDRKRIVNGPVQSKRYNGARSQIDALQDALVKETVKNAAHAVGSGTCNCPLHAGRTHPAAGQGDVQQYTEPVPGDDNDPALD